MNQEREIYLQYIPKIYQGVYRKAMKGNSLRAAINAKCQDCSNWQREEVRNCTVKCCPLWIYRPYREPKGARNEAV